MKKHSARVNAITSAQEAQKEEYDRAQLGGGESEDDRSESYEEVDKDVETGVERPNKRRRTLAAKDMVGHK